jgi:hypothetical protein
LDPRRMSPPWSCPEDASSQLPREVTFPWPALAGPGRNQCNVGLLVFQPRLPRQLWRVISFRAPYHHHCLLVNQRLTFGGTGSARPWGRRHPSPPDFRRNRIGASLRKMASFSHFSTGNRGSEQACRNVLSTRRRGTLAVSRRDTLPLLPSLFCPAIFCVYILSQIIELKLLYVDTMAQQALSAFDLHL